MSVGDETLEPIHEDDGESEHAAGATNTLEGSDDESAYDEEEFYEDDNEYTEMTQGGALQEVEGEPTEQPEMNEPLSEKEQDVKELMDLQRKYRMMMGDRQSFQKHAQSKLRQQNTHLSRLHRENEEMKKELGAHVPRSTSKGKLSAQSSKLNRLSDEEEKLLKALKAEQKKGAELDKQGQFLSRRIKSAREAAGPASAYDSQAFIMKQVRVLENRLDKALVKFNEAVSHNKSLRSEIDDLRREKNVYDGIYKKLERDLNEKKRIMADIIEMSNQSYEARDQSEHQIELIKKQMRQREELWEAELKQLNQKLESFERVQKLMADSFRGSLDQDQEAALKKKVRGNAWKLGADKAKLAEKKDLTESYEEMFLRIRQATKINDMDVIVESFIEAEDRNFSLFNYVNELTMEVEKLEEGIGEHQAELEKELDDDSNMNTRSKKIIKDLEDKLVKTEAKAEHYEAKLRQITEEMDVTYNVVESLFSRLDCEQLANTEILGSGGVSESNIMLYLGVIEQRTNGEINSYLTRDKLEQQPQAEEAPPQLKPAPPPRPPQQPKPTQEPESALEEEETVGSESESAAAADPVEAQEPTATEEAMEEATEEATEEAAEPTPDERGAEGEEDSHEFEDDFEVEDEPTPQE